MFKLTISKSENSNINYINVVMSGQVKKENTAAVAYVWLPSVAEKCCIFKLPDVIYALRDKSPWRFNNSCRTWNNLIILRSTSKGGGRNREETIQQTDHKTRNSMPCSL